MGVANKRASSRAPAPVRVLAQWCKERLSMRMAKRLSFAISLRGSLNAMLQIESLSVPGLRPVSFSLSTGECVAVRGPSGAGKTLLLRAIVDLDPNIGSVLLDGVDRQAMPGPLWRRRVGYVPAEPGWWADRIGEHFGEWSAALPLVQRLGLPEGAKDW